MEHVCFETADASGFYVGRSWVQRGNVVRHNTFRDIRATTRLGSIAAGAPCCQQVAFYLDDEISGFDFYGNTIEDAGLGKMASKQKQYIGNVLRKRPVMLDKNRPRLVGIFPKDRTQRFNAGTILCKPDAISGFGEGWITGATYSPALGHWIGIGFISGGFESWIGQTVVVADPVREQNINVEIVLPHMFDPAGKRLHD